MAKTIYRVTGTICNERLDYVLLEKRDKNVIKMSRERFVSIYSNGDKSKEEEANKIVDSLTNICDIIKNSMANGNRNKVLIVTDSNLISCYYNSSGLNASRYSSSSYNISIMRNICLQLKNGNIAILRCYNTDGFEDLDDDKVYNIDASNRELIEESIEELDESEVSRDTKVVLKRIVCEEIKGKDETEEMDLTGEMGITEDDVNSEKEEEKVNVDETETSVNEADESVEETEETAESADEGIEESANEADKSVEESVNEADKSVEEPVKDLIREIEASNEIDSSEELVINTDDMEKEQTKIKEEQSKKIENAKNKMVCNCRKCLDTGYYTDEMGITYKCTCGLIDKKKEDKPKTVKATLGMEEAMIADGIIHRDRIHDEFVTEEGAKVLATSIPKGYNVNNFNKYCELLNSIITACKLDGVRVDASYLIGGDNGFGKTTFVNTCLKALYARNKKVVPYVTLYELARLRAQEENEIREKLIYGYRTEHESLETEEEYFEIVKRKYKWEDYLSADVLFCSLGSSTSVRLETEIMYEILRIRGMRRLPTIVTTENALSFYTNSKDMSKNTWGNMINYGKTTGVYDKLIHVSSYKKEKTYVDMNLGRDI